MSLPRRASASPKRRSNRFLPSTLEGFGGASLESRAPAAVGFTLVPGTAVAVALTAGNNGSGFTDTETTGAFSATLLSNNINNPPPPGFNMYGFATSTIAGGGSSIDFNGNNVVGGTSGEPFNFGTYFSSATGAATYIMAETGLWNGPPPNAFLTEIFSVTFSPASNAIPAGVGSTAGIATPYLTVSLAGVGGGAFVTTTLTPTMGPTVGPGPTGAPTAIVFTSSGPNGYTIEAKTPLGPIPPGGFAFPTAYFSTLGEAWGNTAQNETTISTATMSFSAVLSY